MSKYLTEYERYQIEAWLKDGVKAEKIAEYLHKSVSCIYGEIRKGKTELIDSELRPYKVYLADVAQAKHELVSHNKGNNVRCRNQQQLLNYISDMMVNQKLSPFAVSELLKDTDFDYKPCERTIYNYVYAGLIPNVTIHDLPYKKKAKTQENQKDSIE